MQTMASSGMIVECAVGALAGGTAAPSGTAFRVSHGGRLLVVADAVGPAARASGAAQQAIDALIDVFPTVLDDAEEAERLLCKGFDAANVAATVDDVARGIAAPEGVALAALVLSGQSALVGNVGNSRCYCARGRELSVLTCDHSGIAQLQTATKQGQTADASPDAFQVHYRGLLSRSLGIGAVRADIAVSTASPGDRYVLCTAGLWSELADAQLRDAILRATSPENVCRRLQSHLRGQGPGHALLVAQLSVQR